ncbi:hypothetical protein [Epilithonimonas sp. UC225_85]|uniref:hypothetical protein n=1 Tax=Epilithonimonas sp. UC225_85 TaxID=3350167 RepID=UPI0036D3308D
MIKKFITIKSILFYSLASSQVLTYVGNSALVTIQSQTLFYNGGGFQTAGTAVVNNSGNVMVNGTSTDVVTLANTANFTLKLASTTDYGQLYVTGITQANISGKVNKEYTADYLNGTTGRQQTGIPFYNFTYADLKNVFGNGNINLTNGGNTTSGRFSPSSIFKWNNERARFDQIVGGADTDVIGTPLTYYIVPRRKADGTFFWVPNSDKKTFTGIPVSDMTTSNVQISLSGAYAGSFGYNGSSSNYYGEKYNTYLDDPFRSKTPTWASDYALNLYQLANPFLTNLDLSFIATSEAGNLSDGNSISNLVGVAYYGTSFITNTFSGTTYGTPIVATTSGGVFQGGDISKLIIKPMGEFMVKLSNNTAQTLNLTKTRRFKSTVRSTSTDYSVTAAKNTSDDEGGGIPADKIVKQVAVVMYDLDGTELDRTYYAISPSAVTGYNPSTALMQAYSSDKKIFTKEEKSEGGEDSNYTDKLYINEANELGFKSKQIPLYIDYAEQPYQLKFEVYEKGERVTDGLSSGDSFYFKNNEGQFIKIVDGEGLSMSGSQSSLGLYYELPEGGTLGTDITSNSQTVIAKKNSEWVVRFAKNWKNATVEIYSAAGQLLNSKTQISTSSDYSIPLNYQAKSVFLVKAISEKGEVVIKKIIN